MKTILNLSCIFWLSLTMIATSQDIPNPAIDYRGFLEDAAKVEKERAQKRISEADFMRMAADPSTIVFDARSRAKYELLHIRGAKHLSLPDITAAELEKAIPTKATRVLIYCNNNFRNEPAAFPTKIARASLNIYTFNTLYSYGYTNVYQLGPLIDIKTSKLPFEGLTAAIQPNAVSQTHYR